MKRMWPPSDSTMAEQNRVIFDTLTKFFLRSPFMVPCVTWKLAGDKYREILSVVYAKNPRQYKKTKTGAVEVVRSPTDRDDDFEFLSRAEITLSRTREFSVKYFKNVEGHWTKKSIPVITAEEFAEEETIHMDEHKFETMELIFNHIAKKLHGFEIFPSEDGVEFEPELVMFQEGEACIRLKECKFHALTATVMDLIKNRFMRTEDPAANPTYRVIVGHTYLFQASYNCEQQATTHEGRQFRIDTDLNPPRLDDDSQKSEERRRFNALVQRKQEILDFAAERGIKPTVTSIEDAEDVTYVQGPIPDEFLKRIDQKDLEVSPEVMKENAEGDGEEPEWEMPWDRPSVRPEDLPLYFRGEFIDIDIEVPTPDPETGEEVLRKGRILNFHTISHEYVVKYDEIDEQKYLNPYTTVWYLEGEEDISKLPDTILFPTAVPLECAIVSREVSATEEASNTNFEVKAGQTYSGLITLNGDDDAGFHKKMYYVASSSVTSKVHVPLRIPIHAMTSIPKVMELLNPKKWPMIAILHVAMKYAGDLDEVSKTITELDSPEPLEYTRQVEVAELTEDEEVIENPEDEIDRDHYGDSDQFGKSDLEKDEGDRMWDCLGVDYNDDVSEYVKVAIAKGNLKTKPVKQPHELKHGKMYRDARLSDGFVGVPPETDPFIGNTTFATIDGRVLDTVVADQINEEEAAPPKQKRKIIPTVTQTDQINEEKAPIKKAHSRRVRFDNVASYAPQKEECSHAHVPSQEQGAADQPTQEQGTADKPIEID